METSEQLYARRQIVANTRFLFPQHDPVVLTRFIKTTQKHQAFVVDKTTTFLPLGFETSEVLLLAEPTDHSHHLRALLDASRELVHEKIAKQSTQAAAAAAEVERDFVGVGGEGEEAEVQARVRRELRRRAYRKVLRKEEEREAGVAGRVKEILGRFDKRAWEWEDEMRQKLEHVRKIEKANDMMEKALGSTGHEPEGKGAGQFSGEFGGILEILEEEAQRDGEIMSEEQWIATIRPSSASGADSAASDGTEDDKRARSASKTRG